jgi:Family of unknown function (DUF6399)
MPDFFHCTPDLVKSSALALARHVRHAHQELTKAEEALRKHAGPAGGQPGASAAQHDVEEKRAAVQRWETVQHPYRHHLATFSLTLHPFHGDDSSPQTSAQVQSRLQAEVTAMETVAQVHQLPIRYASLKKVRRQWAALAALVDFWWTGVDQDLPQATISAPWRHWATHTLLPCLYWEHQIAHTRCPRRNGQMPRTWAAARAALDQHGITQQLPPEGLAAWHAGATTQIAAFQRTSSAVEGRNGALAQLPHNQRGLPHQRYKVWTVLHNFDCRASDGTTPGARFFTRTFPDLFETVLPQIAALPLPRRRKGQVVRNH